MYKEDWLLRQIREMINFLIFLLAGKKVNIEEYISLNSIDAQELHKNIQILLKNKEISKAESLIFENIDIRNNIYGIIALGFYQNLNIYSDEELVNMGYSREKLHDGLLKIQEIYGYNVFQ